MSAIEKPAPVAPALPSYEEARPHLEAASVDLASCTTLAAKLAKANATAWLIEHGFASEWPAPKPEKVREPYAPGKPSLKLVREQAREKFKPVAVYRRLSEIASEEFTWLWPGRVPDDRLTVVMGEVEAGKSTWWSWLAAVVTTGGVWPEGSSCGAPGSVVVLQSEEVAGKEVKRRIESFGGDPDKVIVMEGITRDGEEMGGVSLAYDVPAIEAMIEEIGDVRVIIVDPIGEFTDGITGNNESEVRKVLRPLRALAEEHKVAVILMGHMTKDAERDITHRLLGTSAFLAIARMAWFISEDPFDSTRRCMSLVKGNPEDKTSTGLAYALDDGRLSWCEEPVSMSARQVDNAIQEARRLKKSLASSKGPPPTATKKAMDFILAALADGPKLQQAVTKDALASGLKESSVLKAVARLLGRTKRDGPDDDGCKPLVMRRKVDPSGKKSKLFWLGLTPPPEPGDPAPPVAP